MTPSLMDWELFLRYSHGAAALPLVIVGLSMMLFGWRLWRFCVCVSFGIIAGGLGVAYLSQAVGSPWLAFGVCGGVVAVVCYWPATYLLGLLGGVLCAGTLCAYLGSLGISGTTLWALGAAALIAGTAYAFLNRGHVVIFVTAFLGAVALVSGLAALVMTVPSLDRAFGSMASYSFIVGPFLLLVPTVMSCFYQTAEVRRSSMTV